MKICIYGAGAIGGYMAGLKSHQAWESAEDMAPLLGSDTAVVTAQNGVPWCWFYGLEGPYI